MEIPPGFPDVLLPALPDRPTPGDSALIAAPDLEAFWRTLAEHVPVMVAAGWDRFSAAAALTGAVFVPLAMGYDFHGTLPRRVRDGVNMDRRRKAATLARDLAGLLDEIAREPLPPDGVLSLLSLLPSVSRGIPSYFYGIRMAEALPRLAEALETPPDFSAAAGLASQKVSWRGFIREVKANLTESGLNLRELDAVALVAALADSEGMVRPSRGSVAAALRAADGEPG